VGRGRFINSDSNAAAPPADVLPKAPSSSPPPKFATGWVPSKPLPPPPPQFVDGMQMDVARRARTEVSNEELGLLVAAVVVAAVGGHYYWKVLNEAAEKNSIFADPAQEAIIKKKIAEQHTISDQNSFRQWLDDLGDKGEKK
jgi:hypothetical protein